MNDDDAHEMPEPDQQQADRSARRAIAFEESLRAATAFMVVVFSVSIVTAFPFVPVWTFPAALGGVVLSVPAAVYVRVRAMRPDEPRTLSSLWSTAVLGAATFGLVLALLMVIMRMTDLGTALMRLGGVLVALSLIAWLRGWRPSTAESVEQLGQTERP